jgi:hypothetical protein
MGPTATSCDVRNLLYNFHFTNYLLSLYRVISNMNVHEGLDWLCQEDVNMWPANVLCFPRAFFVMLCFCVWCKIVTWYHKTCLSTPPATELFRGSASYLKMTVFWVVAPCSLVEVYWHFRGACCPDYRLRGTTTQKTDIHLHTRRCENLKSHSFIFYVLISYTYALLIWINSLKNKACYINFLLTSWYMTRHSDKIC